MFSTCYSINRQNTSCVKSGEVRHGQRSQAQTAGKVLTRDFNNSNSASPLGNKSLYYLKLVRCKWNYYDIKEEELILTIKNVAVRYGSPLFNEEKLGEAGHKL